MNLKSLALTLPGGQTIDNPPLLKITGLGGFLSGLLNIAFYVAMFLAFYYLIWGAFQYIVASGKKDELQKARQRINWALVGLIVVFLAYFIAKFASEIFPPWKGGLPF